MKNDDDLESLPQAARPCAWLPSSPRRCAVVLAGCGDKKKDKAASQTAAKVNKEEITVHQINYVLQQQRGLKPEQADAASQADPGAPDRPGTGGAEGRRAQARPRPARGAAARGRQARDRCRAPTSRRRAKRPAKPTPEEIQKYYDDKPALFKERRIYSLQEIAIEAKPEQIARLTSQARSAKNITEFVDYLKANDFRFTGNQAVRAAEQLPLASLDAFAADEGRPGDAECRRQRRAGDRAGRLAQRSR